MDVYDFHSWLHCREREQHDHVPAADLVVPLVAQAGQRGLSRAEIGDVIDLDREELDRLLAALVEFGLLSATTENGLGVFRYLGSINFIKFWCGR